MDTGIGLHYYKCRLIVVDVNFGETFFSSLGFEVLGTSSVLDVLFTSAR